MRLKFVSDGKIIEFDGSGQCDGSIISVSGLEGVTRDYQTVKYVDVPGQITVAENVLPREIVVKGDIFLKNSMNFSGYCNFFDQWGLLHILRDTSRKKIAYKPVYFKRVGDNGDFVSFELKIICDFPYFSDSVNNFVDIYKRIDKVVGTFTLPKVFTERITEADIMNMGQVVAEPVIELDCVAPGRYSGGIHIRNTSTGKTLVIKSNMISGEKIVFDIKNRTISSNKRQNCYGLLSDECTLADFFLQKGLNKISIENKNDAETVKVVINFENLYTEAM